MKKYASSYVTANLRLATNPLSDEIKAELEKLMDEEAEGLKKWNREQRNASRRFNEMRNTMKGRKEAADEFKKIFAEADSDKDGRLSLEDWISFVDKTEAARKARNEPSTPKSEEYKT